MDTHTLTIKLAGDVADLITKMKMAEGAMAGSMQGIEGVANRAKLALGGLAAGLSIGAFAGMIRGSIDAMDSLNDLSKSTGLAVDQLAGLKLAAKQSGGDLDGIAASVNKLSVAMGKDAERFAKLGVTAKDPLEAFKQLADVFSAIQDPQLRAALGAEALGKSWSSAAPLLSEGGKKIGEMIDKGKAMAGVTQDMADRADEFNDMMAELGTATDGAKMKLAGEMLPAMTNITKAITTAYEESGKLQAIWVALGALGAFAFTDEFASASVKIKDLQFELSGLEAKKKTVSDGGVLHAIVFGSKNDLTGEIEAVKSQIKALQDLQKKPELDAAAKAAQAKADAANAKEAQAAATKAAEFLRLNEAAKNKAASDAASALKAQDSFIKGITKESEALTLGNAVSKEHEAVLLGITGAKLAYVKATLAGIDAYKAAVKSAQERSDLRKKEYDDIDAYMVAQTAAYAADVKGSKDALKAAQDEYDQYGLTKSQIAEITLLTLESTQAKYIDGSEGFKAVQKQIDAQKQLIGVLQKTEIREEWKSIFSSIDQTAHSVWTNVLQGGQDVFTKIEKTIKASVWDMLYQLTAKKWLINIGASITGTAGMSAAAMAAGSGGGGGAIASLSAAQTLGGIYNTITGGFTAAATSIANLGVKLGGQLIDMGAEEIGYKLMEWSSNPGTVSGLAGAGGIIAGVVLGSMIAGDKVVFGLDGTSSSAIGAAIGFGVGGPIGAAIGGALGGVFNAAFGHGATQVREQGTRGTFSGSGFSGSNYANMHQDGGWFSSDNDWTQTSAIDSGTLKAWSDAFVGVKSAVASTAASIGLSADAIASYSRSIDLAAGSSKETITAMFTNMADEMALRVAPGLGAMIKEGETASVTLGRLSTTLSTANIWLAMLDDKLLNVSLSGAEASSKLADMFGGLDKFTASAKTFYELFYSEGERSAQSQIDMAKALALLNIAMPGSKESFKNLAKTLDLTTDYGRQAYSVLLTIAPEYAATSDLIAKLAKESGDKMLKLFTVAGNVDFAKVGQALTSANTETFVSVLNQVFVDLSARIKTTMDSIASERTAVSNAAAQINGPKDITYSGLQSEIAAIKAKSGLPSDAGVIAANAALVQANAAAVAAQKLVTDASSGLGAAQSAKANMATYYQGKANEFHAMASGYGLTANATGYNNDAYNYNASTNKLNQWNSIGYTNTNTSSSSFFGLINSSSSSSTLANKPAFLAAADSLIKTLVGGNTALAKAASAIAPAQAKLTAATLALPATLTAQTAAAAAAKKAALDYAASIQAYVVEASKSVPALTKLREETVAYYEAQKALADGMKASATGLRDAATAVRLSQLDSVASAAQKRADFEKSYSLALATSGADKAGYADKMAAALPALSDAIMETSTKRDWAFATAKLAVQSNTIANQLDMAAAVDYQGQSLGLLASIDSTLAMLDDSTSAITRAIAAGSDLTAAGLRGIITQLGGVPAFAGGGYHSGGLRIVGENGPELEVTGPSRIYNASQLRALGSGGQGGSSAELVVELRALRQENAEMRAEMRAITVHVANTADNTRRMDRNGVLVFTDPAAPIDTKVAA